VDRSGEDGPRQARRSEPADWSQMADERLLRGQMRRRLVAAIDRLPGIYRAPVVLRDVRGMSTEEASLALRVTDQTMKSRLHRARLILRRRLADFAGGLSMHHPAAC
jgi:RNA polymerase sigma-70 factor (ECF subfamily)